MSIGSLAAGQWRVVRLNRGLRGETFRHQPLRSQAGLRVVSCRCRCSGAARRCLECRCRGGAVTPRRRGVEFGVGPVTGGVRLKPSPRAWEPAGWLRQRCPIFVEPAPMGVSAGSECRSGWGAWCGTALWRPTLVRPSSRSARCYRAELWSSRAGSLSFGELAQVLWSHTIHSRPGGSTTRSILPLGEFGCIGQGVPSETPRFAAALGKGSSRRNASTAGAWPWWSLL